MHAKVTSNGAVGSGGKFSNRLALGARRSRNPVPFVAKHNVEPPVKVQRVRNFGNVKFPKGFEVSDPGT